jgi:hypothetical protein
MCAAQLSQRLHGSRRTLTSLSRHTEQRNFSSATAPLAATGVVDAAGDEQHEDEDEEEEEEDSEEGGDGGLSSCGALLVTMSTACPPMRNAPDSCRAAWQTL